MGPLVVAGVAAPDPDALRALGCRDSKRLSPERRSRLARLLADDPLVAVTVVTIDVDALDAGRATRTLNDLELDAFRIVARRLAGAGAGRVHLDSVDVDPARFAARVGAGLAGVTVTAAHRADGDDVVVAAASIVAKVERDRLIADLARRLERRLGMSLGSGYPSDPLTRAFLSKWVESFGDLPPGTRRSWRTARDLLAPRQVALPDFGKP